VTEPVTSVPVGNHAMAWNPTGTFRMGSDRHYREEAPAREVHVDGFSICRTAVTNLDHSSGREFMIVWVLLLVVSGWAWLVGRGCSGGRRVPRSGRVVLFVGTVGVVQAGCRA